MDNKYLIPELLFIVGFLILLKRLVRSGWVGESAVAFRLRWLDSVHYRTLNNLLLPSEGKTKYTQIDHVVVSNYGIFCIETKDYSGWIFGRANQEYWTQTIFHYHKKFYNPLRQNYAHVKAIEQVIGENRLKSPIVPLVVFTIANTLNISGTDAVGNTNFMIKKIKSYTTPIYSDTEKELIYNLLVKANIVDNNIRRLHDKRVGELKKSD